MSGWSEYWLKHDMARKSKVFYEGYISRNQSDIIYSLAKEGNKLSLFALNILLEIEMSNKAREGVITKLRDFLNIKEEKEIVKRIKKEKKLIIVEERKKMGKQRFAIWRGQTNGLSLPEQFNRITLVKDVPIPLTDDAIEYLTANWPKEDFEITDKAETEEEKKRK